jgi:hypothetical protein
MRPRLTHPVGAVELRQLHASTDESGDDLPRLVDDGVLGRVHVKAAHAAKLLDEPSRDEPLDAEGAKGAAGGETKWTVSDRASGKAASAGTYSCPAKEQTIGAVIVLR